MYCYMNDYVCLKFQFNEVKCCRYTFSKGLLFVTYGKRCQLKSGFIINSKNQVYKKRTSYLHTVSTNNKSTYRKITYEVSVEQNCLNI